MEKKERTNRDVIDRIFNMIEFEGVEIIEKNFGDGYFLFELGDNAVCHFKVKGAKRWLFGIWATLDDGKWHISLFGEHEDYIDKFKPTRTSVSYIMEMDDIERVFDDSSWVEELRPLYDFTDSLQWIVNHPLIMKFKLYGGPWESFVKFHIQEFLYYRIKRNIRNFIETKCVHFYLCVLKMVYNTVFRLGEVRKTDFGMNIIDRGEGWSPRYKMEIRYDGCDDDTIERIYCRIEREKNGKRKIWLMPKWVFSKIGVGHYEDNDTGRSFYIEKKEEE